MILVRRAVLGDLPVLTDIYNHYIVHSTITFDLQPFTPDDRRDWFDAHAGHGRHRLIVAEEESGTVVGYATTSRWRPKPAYDTTVESSVYCRPDCVGRGVGSKLYHALFDGIADEGVHRIVAGVAMPNPASVALHRRLGFEQVGVFAEVGLKFGRYWDVAWYARPAS